MAEEAPAKVPKKRAPRTRTSGLQLWKLVINAIKATSGRKGTSVVGIKKYLKSNGVDVKKSNKQINNTIIRLKNKAVLVQVTGNGASGSFKLAKSKKEPRKPSARKPTKKKTTEKKKKTTPKKKKTTTKKKDTKKPGAKKAAGRSPRKAGAKKNTRKTAAKKKTTPRKNKPTKRTLGAKRTKSTARKTTPKKAKK